MDTPSNFDESSRDRYHVQVIVSWADTKGIAVPAEHSDRIKLMKKLSDNWAEPFRSLVQKLPEDTEARSIRIEDWMFQPGRAHAHHRVALMGDSAHTMTMCKCAHTFVLLRSYFLFFLRKFLLTYVVRGEGANNAIVDVLDLVKRVDMEKPEYVDQSPFHFDIANSSRSFEYEALSASLEKYEKDIFARVEPSFLNSRQACLDAHDFSKIEGSPLVMARVLKKHTEQ